MLTEAEIFIYRVRKLIAIECGVLRYFLIPFRLYSNISEDYSDIILILS